MFDEMKVCKSFMLQKTFKVHIYPYLSYEHVYVNVYIPIVESTKYTWVK